MAQPASLVIAAFALLLLAFASAPEFYRDILPILQTRCQGCHRQGEMAPMPLVTYQQVRPFSRQIRKVVENRSMPPWFADPCCGHFANDPSLTPEQIKTIAEWSAAGAPPGDWKKAPEPVVWAKGWNIPQPDLVLPMPAPMRLPETGDVPYQYIIIPTHFRSDTWVQMSEIRPSNRMAVHHAVAYIRPPGSDWLRGAPIGKPFSADDLPEGKARRDAMWTTSDILLVYAPGSAPDRWPAGYAKLVPAGSDLVLQMHYTTHGMAMSDQTSVGLVISPQAPSRRVLSLQLTNSSFLIPPGDPDHRVSVHGSVPNDAELLSFFPHMHLRGKSFEYDLLRPGKPKQVLLRVPQYSFFWQLSYQLAQPIALHAGDVLQAVATFDNSKNNPHNPDPDVAVRWGEQTWAEMMIGFLDVAVDPKVDKNQFFIRRQ